MDDTHSFLVKEKIREAKQNKLQGQASNHPSLRHNFDCKHQSQEKRWFNADFETFYGQKFRTFEPAH